MIRFIRWCLIAGALIVIALDMAGSSVFPDVPYTGIRHSNLVFYELERESPNAGMQLLPGDRILAVDGAPARNINHFRYLAETVAPGTKQIYTIARGDSLFDVTVESAQQPIRRIHRRIASSLTAYTFIFLSLIVIMRRPDILGLLFTVNCLIIAFLLTRRPITGVQILNLGGELAYDFLVVYFPAFFLHFFLIFPGKEIREGTKRFLASKVLYIPPAILFLVLFAAAMMSYTFGIEPAVLRVLNGVTSIYWLSYIIGCVIVIIRTYIVSDKIQRGKFRIATIGLILGVAPLSVVMFLRHFIPAVQIPHEHVSVIFLSFISASFAFAILRYDAFDMRFVFRAGIILVLAPAILAATIWLFGGLMGDRLAGMLNVRFFTLVLLAAAVFFTALAPAGTPLHRIADLITQRNRKIFGERVIDFSRRIQSVGTLQGIVNFVSVTIREMFGAEFVYFFIGGGGTYVLSGGDPEGTGLPLTSLPGGADLVRLSGSRKLPLMVEYYDRIWINSNLDRTSREFLSLSGAAVIVPLVDQDELLGFILCGRKQSAKPYSGVDAEILELLGERSAAAVRNFHLYRASKDKERLEEEMRLAREIQLRLLPAAPPRLDHAEVLGGIRTSMEVGGDLFDYVELAPGVVGIAVADVAGKGIPASLIMTALQAGFRAEACMERSPAQVLEALNRALYEHSDETSFATFFYAVYDDRSRLLRYCNAGAFPPVLIRSDATLVRLQRGGALIGINQDTFYSDGIMKLRPGDLLVSYTDGFIDQENRSGDYFGEARIIAFLRANRDLELDRLLEKLFEAVLGFGSGTIRDDMTAVTLRVLP